MKLRKLNEKVKPLRAMTLAERLLYCAGLLHIGGYMTDAERKRVHKRMMKQKAREEN